MNGILIDTTQSLAYRTVTIRLVNDSVEVAATMAHMDGSFGFQAIWPGTYRLILSDIGQRDQIRDNIIIASEEVLQVSIQYPGPCLFNYPKHYQPKCPENHTDHLVKLVYGLPNQKTMRKAKSGKIHLAGCMVTDCDPQYYCQKHQIAF